MILQHTHPGRLFDNRKLSLASWIGAACIFGFLIATQPFEFVILALGVSTFVVLASITPLTALMILLVLAPMRVLIATEADVQLPLDIGQILLISFMGFWLINRICWHQPIIPPRLWSAVHTPITLIIVVGGLSIINAVSLSAWFNEWLKWVQIFVLVIFCLDLAKNDLWHWLIFGLVLSGVANALVGIYEFFGGSGADHLAINGRFFRAFGTFGQPNPFGGFMGLLAPLALMATLAYLLKLCDFWLQTRKISSEYLVLALFYGTSSILILVGLGFSWSRGAWLGFVISMLVVAFALPYKTRYSLLLLGSSSLLAAFIWFGQALPSSIINRINSATEEYFSVDDVRGVDITPENYAVVERLAHWQAATAMANHNFWLGVGLGNYEVAYPFFDLLNWHESLGHAHNYYLNIWAEAGFIGLLGYSKAWLLIIWLTWRTREHPDMLARFIAVGLLGTWSYLSVHSFTDNLYVNNLFLHLGVLLGILAVLYSQVWKSVGLKL